MPKMFIREKTACPQGKGQDGLGLHSNHVPEGETRSDGSSRILVMLGPRVGGALVSGRLGLAMVVVGSGQTNRNTTTEKRHRPREVIHENLLRVSPAPQSMQSVLCFVDLLSLFADFNAQVNRCYKTLPSQ